MYGLYYIKAFDLTPAKYYDMFIVGIPVIILFFGGDLASAVILNHGSFNYLIAQSNDLMVGRTPLVRGQIVFDVDVKPLRDVTVYVRLVDVTLMDVASKIISEQVIKNVNHDPVSHSNIEFSVTGDQTNNKASYSISVHVDVDNDGKLSAGDFTSFEAIPVVTFGYPQYVSVRVRQI